ncbi:MAG: LamG domain-containing protein [Bdellovibrionia bacterium]
MKFSQIAFSLLPMLLTSSCGPGFPSDPVLLETTSGNSTSSTSPLIASGAKLLLDANDFSANGSTPASSCASTTWVDLSGGNHNGTLNCAGGGGFTGAGTTANPYAVSFNGTSTYVATSLNTQSNTMPSTTWVAWVKPGSGSFSHLMSIDNHGGAFNRSILTDGSGNWGVFTGPSAPTTYTPVTYTQGQWQNLAVVFTATDIIIYLNGTPYDRASAPSYGVTANSFTIGRSGGAAFDYFTGAVNWLAVYDRALTASEVSDTCKALQSRFSSVACN